MRTITSPNMFFTEFVSRARDGDLEGLVALYHPDAKAFFEPNKPSIGHDEIREDLRKLLETPREFTGEGQRETLVMGDIALTSAAIGDRVTAEVAQRQPDGTWLWIIDHPNFTSSHFPD